jgi:uroporphyrinogen decarboxylase
MLVGQWRAGASLLQVFESSAGELSPEAWEEFSLPYLLQIAKRVRASVPAVADGGPPLVCFARAAHHAYEALAGHYNVLGVDWAVRPSEVVARVRAADPTGTTTTLQGNLDPGHLYGTKESISRATRAMLEGFGTMPLIANLGWGMHPTHKPEGLRAYFEAVHSESRKLRAKA